MDMLARNLEQEPLDAFNQFGRSVTASVRQTDDNKLHVKMYGSSRCLMDMAAYNLREMALDSGTLFYPVWVENDGKVDKNRSGVTLRIPLELALVYKVNEAYMLTKTVMDRAISSPTRKIWDKTSGRLGFALPWPNPQSIT